MFKRSTVTLQRTATATEKRFLKAQPVRDAGKALQNGTLHTYAMFEHCSLHSS